MCGAMSCRGQGRMLAVCILGSSRCRTATSSLSIPNPLEDHRENANIVCKGLVYFRAKRGNSPGETKTNLSGNTRNIKQRSIELCSEMGVASNKKEADSQNVMSRLCIPW